jgi:hypothetical protein
VLRGAGLVGQQQRHRAVVDAAGIAGGHAAVGAHHALEPGQRLEAGLARMLVLADEDRMGHAVLGLALDPVVRGDDLGGLEAGANGIADEGLSAHVANPEG